MRTEGAGTMTVPASDPSTQAKRLGLCSAEGATCSFRPTGQVEALHCRASGHVHPHQRLRRPDHQGFVDQRDGDGTDDISTDDAAKKSI